MQTPAAHIPTLLTQGEECEPQKASKQGAWWLRCLMTVF